MSNMINISFMCEDAIDTLKSNTKKANNYIKNWKESSDWLSEIYSGQLFEEKKYKIPDFELAISENGNYDEVDFGNSIILYNALKELPLYILTDERFWAWINFKKGYKQCANPDCGKKIKITGTNNKYCKQCAREKELEKYKKYNMKR